MVSEIDQTRLHGMRFANQQRSRELLLSALEIKITNAGNMILDAKRKDGLHSDLAIAAAIALYASSQAYIGSHVGQLAGDWG